MEAVRERMTKLVTSGEQKSEASEGIRSETLSWTMEADGLFMQRSIPGVYDEIAAEIRR